MWQKFQGSFVTQDSMVTLLCPLNRVGSFSSGRQSKYAKFWNTSKEIEFVKRNFHMAKIGPQEVVTE